MLRSKFVLKSLHLFKSKEEELKISDKINTILLLYFPLGELREVCSESCYVYRMSTECSARTMVKFK